MAIVREKAAFTSGEVAAQLGVNHTKVCAWIRAGELAAINVSLRTTNKPKYRIPVEALTAFLARRAVVPPPATAPRQRRQFTDAPQYV